MRRCKTALLVCALTLLLPALASAHYLWVTVTPDGEGPGRTNIYFEEGPHVGDGFYLDPFITRGKTWIRTVESPEPVELEISEINKADKKQRWLTGPLTAAAPRSIDSYGKWGVYRYGKTDVLLHYYARHLDVSGHEELHELGRAEKFALDIVPHETDGAMELTVLWEGKPAADRVVFLRGPKGFRQNLKTDEKGQVRFEQKEAGQYLIRTSYDEVGKGGTFEGKEYSLTRHNGTLVIRLPVGP